jgi:hypothetical protein
MESHLKPAAQPINKFTEAIATNKRMIRLILPRYANNLRLAYILFAKVY